MPTELFANNVATTLASGINNSVTTLTVASSAGFPTPSAGVSQFRVIIDTELLIVTAVSGTTWTVTRGAESTTAASHSSGDAVTHVVTAAALVSLSTSGNGLPSTFQTKTTTYTAAAGEFVLADTTSAGFTVTLPTAPATGALVSVKKTSADTNTLTIAPAGGGTIDGAANATTVTQNAGLVLEHSGSNAWRVAASMSTTGPAGTNGTNGTNAVLSTIEDEGSALTQRSNLNFVGAGVTAADSGGKTVVTIPGGGGSGMPVETRTGGAQYHAMSGVAGINLAITTVGETKMVPIVLSKSCTADRIGIKVTTATAGATIRLGIYTDDGSFYPSTLVLDAGTVSAATTGFKEITISQALSAGVYWLAANHQGSAGTVTVQYISSIPLILPWTSAAFLDNPPAGYADNGGVTGALPGTITPTYMSEQAPRILLRLT